MKLDKRDIRLRRALRGRVKIRELAAARLEKFLDPTKVRSDLLETYRQLQRQQMSPNIELDEETLFGSPRPWVRITSGEERKPISMRLIRVTAGRSTLSIGQGRW